MNINSIRNKFPLVNLQYKVLSNLFAMMYLIKVAVLSYLQKIMYPFVNCNIQWEKMYYWGP